eukprot:1136704-Pelagomonas_calceolata.AAC.1
MRKFVVDLRNRQQGVWTVDASAEHGEHTNKYAKYHHWMALPLRPLPVHGAPFPVPRYLYLDLGATKEDSKMKNMLCSYVLTILRTFVDLFSDFPSTRRTYMDESGAFHHSQASSEDAFHFVQKQTNEIYCFISKLMDVFCAVGTVEQAEQPNYPAEAQTPL